MEGLVIICISIIQSLLETIRYTTWQRAFYFFVEKLMTFDPLFIISVFKVLCRFPPQCTIRSGTLGKGALANDYAYGEEES